MRVWAIGLLGMVVLIAFTGCGEKVAKVSGKVIADGKPVSEGSLVFKPLNAASKPGAGEINPEGKYKAVTVDGKGLALGSYQVLYVEPVQKETMDDEGHPIIDEKVSQWQGWKASDEPVKVEANENNIIVKLVKQEVVKQEVVKQEVVKKEVVKEEVLKKEKKPID